jgi:hypothetical protein
MEKRKSLIIAGFIFCLALQAMAQTDSNTRLPVKEAWARYKKGEITVNIICQYIVDDTAPSNSGDIPTLLLALKDKVPTVRQAAAFSLRVFDEPKVVKALIRSLKDHDADVRETAATSLGEIKKPAAIPALKALKNDKNSKVREAATNALINIQQHRFD